MPYSLLDPNPEPSRSRLPRRERTSGPLGERVTVFVQILGLLATGWIVWISSVSPRLHRYTWASLVTQAVWYAVLTWLWSAAITFGLYFTVTRRERSEIVDATLRTSTAAVWFAPAIILLTQLSPAALVGSLVLVVSATRLLYSQWRKAYPQSEMLPAHPQRGMFGENEAPPAFFRDLAPALLVAACIQCGATAALMQLPMLAGILLAASAAMLTIFAIAAGLVDRDARRTLPQAAFGVILTVLLASGLTVGGLSGRVVHHRQLAWDDGAPGQRPGMVDSLRAMLRQLFYGEPPPSLDKKDSAKDKPGDDDSGNPNAMPTNTGIFPEGSFPGVILLPEVRPVPLLVEPPRFDQNGMPAHPIGIPFGGQYWFFRRMFHRPPPNSFQRKGSPATLSFSTTDHWPLEMEAHQKFDQPIDLTCCKAVRVQIWNADRYPGTVSLDFFAMNSPSVYSRSLYLGAAPIKSIPDLSRDHVVAVPEMLEFQIPPGAFDNCTEFKLVFRRDPSRADKSARIAVERFVLVP